MLGGDHGKGVFVYIDSIIFRYKNEVHGAKIIDLQIGGIDSGTYLMKYLMPLVQMMEPEIKNLHLNQDGNTTLKV